MIPYGNDIEKAAQIIKAGGLVAFPTETVYGLGASAFNKVAVARIFEVKQRPSFDPLIVHISSIDQLNMLFESPIEPLVYKLAELFWPGPLTIVHKKKAGVPDIITSGLDTVAVRMPSHTTARKLIELAEIPIAAPSANRFGRISPTKPQHVQKQLTGVEYLLTSDEAVKIGIESTVVAIDGDTCNILRPGAITLEHLTNNGIKAESNKEKASKALSSPGLLKSHYAPLKPLYMFSRLPETFPSNSGIIVHSNKYNLPDNIKTAITSDNNTMTEIAANLFESLHQMEDDPSIDNIFIEVVEKNGIGIAIMDRVQKAAFHTEQRYL
ncbi:MAG TPA: L-threonylcarbamoyladenylate synthase [Bacteroidales bacterium]|nr:L-threonylcarbamoyladenylate synthase [Bacteroidales bacterium]